jgi:tripartite-type tricarboxylate transporter receptor subunit TctC
MGKSARALAIAASALFGSLGPLAAQTPAYPSGQVKLVIPLPPGGSTDFVGRLLAAHLSSVWKQTVIVDNRPGGNAMLGVTYVAKSAPDGYTLLLGPPTVASAPATMKVLPITPLKDLSSISQLVELPNVITVHNSVPVKTLRELIDYGKANPGKLNSGTFAMGSLLTSGRFNLATGLKMPLVGYRGEALMMAATAAGEVQVGIATPVTAIEPVSKGQIRALAVTSSQRLAALKDVPTTAEAGLPEFAQTVWFGLFAPAGTPLEIRRMISAEVAEFSKKPDNISKLEGAGLVPKPSTPEEMAALLERETKAALDTAAAIGLEKQ